MNNKQREESLTLEILEAIDEQSDVTQRHLASRMGVALGLANSYLKSCVRKGLVKIQHAPANRYLYYLTPKGFAEKSRLTAEYLSYSFTFYRKASDSCAELLQQCRRDGQAGIGLYGVSDLAEIAALQALSLGVQVACVCDPSGDCDEFLNLPLVRDPADRPDVHVWLVTDLFEPQMAYEALCDRFEEHAVKVPSVLGLGRKESDRT